MFARPRAMSRSSAVQSPAVLAAPARVNEVVQRETYDDAPKARPPQQLAALGLLRSDRGTYATLRKVRGGFVTRRRNGETVVVASGRADWVGWAELTTEPVNELASRHIAYVM